MIEKLSFQLMVDGVTGRSSASVKARRIVVKGAKLVRVLVPTHPPQEAERTVRENPNSARNAKYHVTR